MSHVTSQSQMAFLLMDVQPTNTRFFAADGSFRGADPAFLTKLATALQTAREAGLLVIHVAGRFREGAPEVSPHNRLQSWARREGKLWTAVPQFHPVVAPLPTELLVTRPRISAFVGSDLEVLLRAQAIRHLVMCGIATSGVVLSTVCEAADRDYELTVLSDGCANSDEELQRVLMEKLFPRYAQVTTVEAWSTSLR